jgi:hypothetical protein
MSNSANELVPGLSCEGCTMCCKLLDIDVLEKPRGTWCPKCDVKRGCTIYEVRPDVCRKFYCGYMRIRTLDDRWKPSKSKFLVNFESASNRIAIHADPARADAWKSEPYYSTIKEWARNAARNSGQVIVWAGDTATLVLPDRDKILGIVRDDQFIVAEEKRTARGIEVDFVVVDANDPRVKIR